MAAVEFALVVVAVLVVGMVAATVRLRRRRERHLEEMAAPEPEDTSRSRLADLAGALLKGSVGLVADLLLPDDVESMTADDGTVTLLFSDIEDSTLLNVEIGDAAWADLLASHDELSAALLEQAGGRIVKRFGDGFMAVLPSAEAGLRCAEALREGLRDNPDIGRRLSLRIGVHTSEVVDREGDYFGTGVAKAARVAAMARGDQVLITQAVVDRIASTEGLTSIGRRRLKGFPGRHRLYRLS